MQVDQMEFGLFTYGTLKEKTCFVPRPTMSFNAEMPGILYDLGAFPGMKHGDGVVKGVLHLWDKDSTVLAEFLEQWDRYEQEGVLYDRNEMTFDGVTVYYYVFKPTLTGYPRLEDGVWGTAKEGPFVELGAIT